MTIATKTAEVPDVLKKDLETIGAKFPIDLSKYDKTVKLDPWSNDKLTDEQKKALKENIDIARAAIVFCTATGSASGYGGHTGGPYDTAPEVAILEAVFNGCPDKCVPTLYDEAGHRAGTQYLRQALNGNIPAEQMFFYRKGGGQLPGHPELGMTPGVEFSSGRLGHMWPFVNGVGLANPDKAVICLGSDGSQMEGNDAEAARLAVACKIGVKLFIDDNDVTIAGNPSDYLKGYSVSRTLRGHGLEVIETTEDLDELWAATQKAFQTEGPVAVVIKRQMCEGWEGLAGECHGHDAASIPLATSYLESRGYKEAAALLGKIPKAGDDYEYLGTGERNATRVQFGVEANKQISKLSDEERKRRIRCIDVDLGGSTGIGQIKAEHPDIYISSGIMERGNYSACAGFGQDDRQAIFATFCAFIEMLMSEITMARLNNSNVLAHFSHSGVDDMADNTCHFGLNPFFANNGLALDEHGQPEHGLTKLYWPADVNHMGHVMEEIFWDKGQRFVMSTRSKVPAILKEDGSEFFGKDYKFVKGKDDLIMDGSDGYIVTFGDALYRSIDAATRLKKEGINVGVINKSCLVDVDEEMMAKLAKAPFVLVVESLLETTGLGIRFGTWLLVRGGECNYAHVGVNKLGAGGLHEHAYQQGYDPASIMAKVKEMHAKK
jgi:transketolase